MRLILFLTNELSHAEDLKPLLRPYGQLGERNGDLVLITDTFGGPPVPARKLGDKHKRMISAANQEAREAIEAVNGLLKILPSKEGPSRIDISRYHFVDAKGKERKAAPSAPILKRILITDSEVDPRRVLFAKAASQDSLARKVLGMLTPSGSWADFYKIYELVQADVGGELSELGVSKTDLTNFSRTVNHPEAIGDEARHAVSNVEPPPRPMTFQEASEFIETVIRAWMQSVVVPRTRSN